MANDLKDLTASTFGLLIAYLLPGLLALYTLSLWFTPLGPVFSTFAQTESTAGLFFLVLLGALLLGVELTAFRWVIFECWICRRERLEAADFAKLADEKTMAAFRIAVDEHYRYHQFWGGLSVVIPFAFWGTAQSRGVALLSWEAVSIAAATALVEAVTIAAAITSFRRYLPRARAILKGGS